MIDAKIVYTFVLWNARCLSLKLLGLHTGDFYYEVQEILVYILVFVSVNRC